MEIFLIIILIISQFIAYSIIGFIVRENRISINELADKITATYLSKIEKDFEASKPSDDEGYSPNEVEELTPEEEVAFRFNPPKTDSGDNDQ